MRSAGKKLAALAREIASQPTRRNDPPPDPSSPLYQALATAGALGGAAPVKPRTLYLWPCNVDAWLAWLGVKTQWRDGMGGKSGLDYAGVRAYLDLQGLRGARRRRIFAGIQACEAATLAAWDEQREQTTP